MKIFDSKNTRHRQILKEELVRATKILREYNESNLWKNLSIDVRKAALMSVDDDMGPDFADEYANTEWMRLPDVITNRLDLDKFNIPDNINPMALADFVQKNSSKLPNTAWYQASVGPKLRTDQLVKLLQAGLTSTKTLTKDIIAFILVNAPAITIDYNQLVDKAGDGSSFTPFNGPMGQSTKNKDWRGGMYTGD